MSCYICFFIRHKDDFLRIGSYSRSNAIFRAFDNTVGVPFGGIISLSRENISDLREYINKMQSNIDKYILKYENEILRIEKMPKSTLKEKMELIDEIEMNINDDKQEKDEWVYAENFVAFLDNIMDDARYGGEDSEDSYDDNDYLYCGLEICKPTVDDIVSNDSKNNGDNDD